MEETSGIATSRMDRWEKYAENRLQWSSDIMCEIDKRFEFNNICKQFSGKQNISDPIFLI